MIVQSKGSFLTFYLHTHYNKKTSERNVNNLIISGCKLLILWIHEPLQKKIECKIRYHWTSYTGYSYPYVIVLAEVRIIMPVEISRTRNSKWWSFGVWQNTVYLCTIIETRFHNFFLIQIFFYHYHLSLSSKFWAELSSDYEKLFETK